MLPPLRPVTENGYGPAAAQPVRLSNTPALSGVLAVPASQRAQLVDDAVPARGGLVQEGAVGGGPPPAAGAELAGAAALSAVDLDPAVTGRQKPLIPPLVVVEELGEGHGHGHRRQGCSWSGGGLALGG